MCKRGRVSCCVSQYIFRHLERWTRDAYVSYQSTFQWIPETIKYSWGQTKSDSTSISNETSVSGYLTNYTHDRYCASAPEQHTSNLHSSNHTSVWNREDTLVLTRPQTSVCEGEHSNIIIHSANEGDNAHSKLFISSANPNIDQQDASSASTSSHHLYIIGYDILATLIVVLTTPIVHVCMNIIQKIIYDTQQQLHQLIKYSE